MYIILSWMHKYKQIFTIACWVIVNKLYATDSNTFLDELK